MYMYLYKHRRTIGLNNKKNCSLKEKEVPASNTVE